MRSLLSGNISIPTDADSVPSIKDGELVQFPIGDISDLASPSIGGVVNYVPQQTGNTEDLNSFVTDPTGQTWYISRTGVAAKLGGGSAGGAELGTDYPFTQLYESDFAQSVAGVSVFNGGQFSSQGANLQLVSPDSNVARGINLNANHTPGESYLVEIKVVSVQVGKLLDVRFGWASPILGSITEAGTYTYTYVGGNYSTNSIVLTTNGTVEVSSIRVYAIQADRLIATLSDVDSRISSSNRALFEDALGGIYNYDGTLANTSSFSGPLVSVDASGNLHMEALGPGDAVSLGDPARYPDEGTIKVIVDIVELTGIIDVQSSWAVPANSSQVTISTIGRHEFTLQRIAPSGTSALNRVSFMAKGALTLRIKSVVITRESASANKAITDALKEGLGLKYRFDGSNTDISTFGGAVLDAQPGELTLTAADSGDIWGFGNPSIYATPERLRVVVDIASLNGTIDVYGVWPISSATTFRITSPGLYIFVVERFVGATTNNNLNRVLIKSESSSGLVCVIKSLYIFKDVPPSVPIQIGQNQTGDVSSGVRVGDNIQVSGIEQPLSIGQNQLLSLLPGAARGTNHLGVPHSESTSIGDFARNSRWRGTVIGYFAINDGQSGTAIGSYSYNKSTHGVAIGRGAHLDEAPHTQDGVTLGTGSNLWIGNGWGHAFRNYWDPFTNIIGLVTSPAAKTARYHGYDAYDARANPSSFNVPGGNAALSAGRGTGTGEGGEASLEISPATNAGPNVQNPLVPALKASSATQSDGTYLFIRQAGVETMHRVLIGPAGSGPGGSGKALYIN